MRKINIDILLDYWAANLERSVIYCLEDLYESVQKINHKGNRCADQVVCCSK